MEDCNYRNFKKKKFNIDDICKASKYKNIQKISGKVVSLNRSYRDYISDLN